VQRIVEFPSEGTTLRGRLYDWAEVSRPRPIVIMAHGFSATISGMVADRFAEVFYEAGFVVLLYDHCSFGISDGAPRCEIDAFGQARGYRSAIDFAAGLSGVDGDRVALWGDSLSGGAVIAAGAVDPRVAAVIAQVPACGAEAPPPDPDGSIFDSTCRPYLDTSCSKTRGTTRKGPMPVVSFDQAGTPSLLTPITAYRWFIEYGGRHGTNWVNRASVVAPAEPARWDPVLCATHLKAPSLFVIASEDEMPGADPEVARIAFDHAPPPKEACEIEGGHFGLLHYPSALFDQASGAERSFLLRHLG
jgi:dienelactone hydrolase